MRCSFGYQRDERDSFRKSGGNFLWTFRHEKPVLQPHSQGQVCFLCRRGREGQGGVQREDQGAKVGRMAVLVPRASPLFLKSYPAYMASGITGLQVKITWGFNGCPRPPRVQVGVHSTTEEPALGRDHPAGPRTVGRGRSPGASPLVGLRLPGLVSKAVAHGSPRMLPGTLRLEGVTGPGDGSSTRNLPPRTPWTVSSLALEHSGILILSEHRQRSQLSPQRPAPPVYSLSLP